ncbi:hypothetical protein COS75_00795 [Candidatus Pacearchaeota archaeon CG06_land_8_20_14_3_00_35_12]|nr:MAG: hypothetical protein COS75_00795 [Candidatus Pacearchaeota archaeon CG06_land_8_20_14_3_00_35_12]
MYYHNHLPKIPRKERHNHYNGNGKKKNSDIEIDITFTEITTTISVPQSLFAKNGYTPRLQQLKEQEHRGKYRGR